MFERGTEVHLEFILAPKRDRRGKHKQPPRALVQSRAGPDFSPGVAGNQILKFAVEIAAVGLRAIDMAVAQHLAPLCLADPRPLVFVHRSLKNSSSASLNPGAASMLERWAAGRLTILAPGIRPAISWPCAGGVDGSCSPTMTSV